MADNTVRFTTALPPTVSIAGGATAVTKDTNPTITGTTDAAVGRPVTVKIGGQVLSTTVQSGGAWTVTAPTALTAGQYLVVASVRDAAANAGSTSQTLTVEVNPDPVVLGSAASYSVLAALNIVNGGPTHLTGNLGLSPGISITGFPPGTLDGVIHVADLAAAQAQLDLVTAYNEVNGRTPHAEIVGDLGGQTFHAGIYHKSTALALTGTVTLDAQNLPNQIFIFQGDAALNTAASARVNLINGAQASLVYWQVQGATGTGASTVFAGTILSGGAITLGAGTQLAGRALSRGAVTMDTNPVTTG